VNHIILNLLSYFKNIFLFKIILIILDLNKELCFEEIITDFYDISLILFRNEEGKLGFKLIKKLKSENKINSFFIPINSLLWIRRIFAKIFEEFDGGSQKLKELPNIAFPFMDI